MKWTDVATEFEARLAPASLLSPCVQRSSAGLRIRDRASAQAREYVLGSRARVVVIAVGKGVVGATAAVLRKLPGVVTRGCVVTKQPVASSPEHEIDTSTQLGALTGLAQEDLASLNSAHVTIHLGGHPVPTNESRAACRALCQTLEGLGPDDLVICVLGGGASALICGIEDDEAFAAYRELTHRLMTSGADIIALNTVRSALDPIKAGGLRAQIGPARLITLLLSDVPEGADAWIGSAPTLKMERPGRSQVNEVLSHFSADLQRLTAALTDDAKRPQARPSMADDVADGASSASAAWTVPAAVQDGIHTIASNRDALMMLAEILAQADQALFVAEPRADGNAREHAARLHAAMQEARKQHVHEDRKPAGNAEGGARVHWLIGGELTTRRDGASVSEGARGGRLCELVLAMAQHLDGDPDASFFALASDGDDGNSGLSGCGVDGQSWRRAESDGLDPSRALQHGDAGRVLAAIGAGCWATCERANLNDVWVLSFAVPYVPSTSQVALQRLLNEAVQPDATGDQAPDPRLRGNRDVARGAASRPG